MYDEEKMIDGIMHFKTMPNSEFRPIGLKQLSLRYQELKSRLMEATTDLEVISNEELIEELTRRLDLNN